MHVQISRVQLHHGPRNHGDHQQNLSDDHLFHDQGGSIIVILESNGDDGDR